MDMHARYIEVCRGVQNRLSDCLERHGRLSNIFERGCELEMREQRRDAWQSAWLRYTSYSRTPDTGASHE